MNSPSTTQARDARQRDAALLAEDVDRLLDEHLSQPAEQLAPSSGFVHSVMESIHAQASAPPPLIFPLRYLLFGTTAIACGLLAFVIYAIHAGPSLEPTIEAALQSYLTLARSLTPGQVILCWIWLATFLSITAIAASFRITGNNE
jgi:hypothetical protein